MSSIDRLLRGAGDSSGYPMGKRATTEIVSSHPKIDFIADSSISLTQHVPKPEIQGSQSNVFYGNGHVESDTLPKLVKVHFHHPPCPVENNLNNPVLDSTNLAQILETGNYTVQIASDICAADQHYRGFRNEGLVIGSLSEFLFYFQIFYNFETPWLCVGA